jgi:acetolactate synthase I/II/III large subunit
LRQLGDQEINITDIVRPVTKFAAFVRKPQDIRVLLEKAIYIATHGRPGPVWLDIPLDVQGAVIDERQLAAYIPKDDERAVEPSDIQRQTRRGIELLKKAERPVFLAGHGIRLAGAQKLFLDVVERMGVPVVSSFCGFDLIPTEHPLFMGRIGTIGNRSGNFVLQNADVLLSVGSRNNIRQVSYNWSAYARAAKKIIVDIDLAELNKPTIKPDEAIHADAGAFLHELQTQLDYAAMPSWNSWQEWCHARKVKYPPVLPAQRASNGLVNPYYFIETLTGLLEENALVVAGNGTACVALFQAGTVKKGQRMFWNSGCASMGYDLPAAIGACVAAGRKDVVCIAGDGSLQMNIQELQTVKQYNLPIKLFVLNNEGYLSIRQTQEAFFESRYVGCDSSCGVSFPDITSIASAYGLPVSVIETHDNIEDRVSAVLTAEGPVVCEVRLLPDCKFEPKLSSERMPDGRMVSKPLEDMYPFLDRDEFKGNMLAPEWKP